MVARIWRWAGTIAASAVLACGVSSAGADPVQAVQSSAARTTVTIQTAKGLREFHVEIARTAAQQARGLMFRTDIPANGGMLFTPYPAEGQPREASFWMKNTPSPLDILFIRSDGTVAAIAANVEPYSETPVRSGEIVNAVLEINGGKAAELGIQVGDRVHWTPIRR